VSTVLWFPIFDKRQGIEMSKLKTAKRILFKSSNQDRKQIFHDYLWKLLFNHTIPRLWSVLRPIFIVMAKKTEVIYPEEGNGRSFILLQPESGKLLIPNFADGLKEWVDRKVKPESVVSVESLREISKMTKPSILIISYDWMKKGFLGSGFSFRIFKVAYVAKKNNHKIWIMTCDSFDQRFVIPSTFLVAFCGGCTVMMANTKIEAEKFGLIHPSDPQLWSYSLLTISKFSEAKEFSEREKIAVVAFSGESRRILMMEDMIKVLHSRGWQVKITAHSLDWFHYINLIKSSRITVTTCWLQRVHVNGSKKNRQRLPETSLTGRVLEGFASRSAVFTTPSSTLDFLGFEDGIHYVAIPEKFEKKLQDFTFPGPKELESIGKAGHEHFLRIKYS